MFDWLKNWRKTEEERQEERITAYVDEQLTAVEQRAFEQEMAEDDALRNAVEAEQALKSTLSQLPHLRAPRNFTLDPAVYGQQKRPTLAMQLYPRLRTATAVVGLLLVGIIALNMLTVANPNNAPAALMSESDTVAQNAPAVVDMTRVVTETVAEPLPPAETAADEMEIIEEAEEAEMAEELEMADEPPPAAEVPTGAADSTAVVPAATATVAIQLTLPAGGAGPAEGDAESASPRVSATATLPERLLATPAPLSTPAPTRQPPPPTAESPVADWDFWFTVQMTLLVGFFVLLVATILTRRQL